MEKSLGQNKGEQLQEAGAKSPSLQDFDWIVLEFLDYNNILRAREVRPNYYSRIFSKGLNFSKAIMDFTIFEDMVANPRWGAETGDFFAKPAQETFARLDYLPRTARVFCDLVDEQGRPWEGCPRNLLKRVVSKFEDEDEELRISISVAFEAESYLLRKVSSEKEKEEGVHNASYLPADDSKCFSPDGLEIEHPILSEVMRCLESAGVYVEKVTAEYGPGQYEVNFSQSSPLKSADNFVLYREIWRGVARKHGLLATFMPKPFENSAGSGLHIHLSAERISEHQNKGGGRRRNRKKALEGDAFFKSKDTLSELGLSFVAGLLKHARAISAFCNPTVNSYRRLQLGTWAPALITYGGGNRNSLIRIPDNSTRIEFRSPDSTCNPHLALGAILAAGYDGIKRGLEAPSLIFEDPSRLSEKELRERKLEFLPRNLGEAIYALKKDIVLKKLLGETLCEEFVKLREAEWNRFLKQVTPWEIETYIETY